MAKPKRDTQPITKTDIEEYLSHSDDFRFEIDVLRGCHESGLITSHGGSYEDQATKKSRQFDIRAQITKGICTLKLAVECKNLRPNFPLLVSRMPRRANESYHEVILSAKRRLREALLGTVDTGADTYRLNSLVFRPNEPVGKATIQIGRTSSGELISNDSEVFEKWSQAIASAYDLIATATADYQIAGDPTAATIVFPVLVVGDGALWTIDYSTRGEILRTPTPSSECSLYLDKNVFTGIQGVEYNISHLQIFTKTAFDAYLGRIASNDDYWNSIFPSNPLDNQLLELELEGN